MFLRYKIEKWAESSAQRIGLFSIGSGIGNIPNIGLGRSVEICAWAFLGIYFSLGYFRVFQGISGYIEYHLFFGGVEPNIRDYF